MSDLPTINIKGKEYVMVKDRIVAFNEMYPYGSIHTEIIENSEKSVIVKATITTSTGSEGRSFHGHSEAYRNKGPMGDVPVEVAETSAVGRALAMLGIGIIESVASADEVRKASGTHQDAPGRTEPLNIDPRVPVIHTVTEDEPLDYGQGVRCAHNEIAKRVQTKKPGPNKGRYFYTCARPMNEQCKFFQWEEEGDFTPDEAGQIEIEEEKLQFQEKVVGAKKYE